MSWWAIQDPVEDTIRPASAEEDTSDAGERERRGGRGGRARGAKKKVALNGSVIVILKCSVTFYSVRDL